MSCDAASVRVGIEHRVDDGIRVEAAFEQRLDHRAAPELPRLDPLEIHYRRDTLSEGRNQLAISFERRQIVGGPIRIDEIAGGGDLGLPGHQGGTAAMTSRRWGRIIMVASVTGPVMAIRADVAYATAKAGMVGLTRAAAVDSARHGITVNAVAPGWIATGSQTPEERGQGRVTPAGRSGSPDEVAAAIAWLASPGASYITGQYLVVDGGNSIAEQRAAPG